MRQRDADLPLDAVAIESGQQLELIQDVGAPGLRGVQVGQFLPSRDQSGRHRDGFFERLFGVGPAVQVAEGEAQQVVHFGRRVGGLARPRERGDGASRIAGAVARDGELVVDAGEAVVERQRALVGLGRALEPLQLIQGIAEVFAGTGGGGVERGRVAEVPDGGVEVASALIGLAPAQAGQHRIGPEGRGAAVGLDGRDHLFARSAASPLASSAR